jgi:hypothetical protein
MEILVAAKKSAHIGGIFCYRLNFGAATFCITTFISTKAEKVALNNQVQYWRCKNKTHKHYNCLQWLLKWKVHEKVIKMQSWMNCVGANTKWSKSGGKRKRF